MNKTKTLVIGAFVSVLVIGTTVFASSSDPGSQTDPITTKSYVDSQLNSKADNLQSQMNTANAKVVSLEGQLKTANTNISDLQKRIKALEDKFVSQPQQPTTPAPTPAPAPSPTYKTGTVTAATSLNVRSGASTSKSIVGSIKNGVKVTILTSKSVSGTTWYQIKSGTLTGWVHGGYIKVN